MFLFILGRQLGTLSFSTPLLGESSIASVHLTVSSSLMDPWIQAPEIPVHRGLWRLQRGAAPRLEWGNKKKASAVHKSPLLVFRRLGNNSIYWVDWVWRAIFAGSWLRLHRNKQLAHASDGGHRLLPGSSSAPIFIQTRRDSSLSRVSASYVSGFWVLGPIGLHRWDSV